MGRVVATVAEIDDRNDATEADDPVTSLALRRG